MNSVEWLLSRRDIDQHASAAQEGHEHHRPAPTIGGRGLRLTATCLVSTAVITPPPVTSAPRAIPIRSFSELPFSSPSNHPSPIVPSQSVAAPPQPPRIPRVTRLPRWHLSVIRLITSSAAALLPSSMRRRTERDNSLPFDALSNTVSGIAL